jgi:RimJ/RimL family protein N-acetyltransferase
MSTPYTPAIPSDKATPRACYSAGRARLDSEHKGRRVEPVNLRRVTVDDARLINGWRSEPSVAAYQPILPLTLDEVRAMAAGRAGGTISPASEGDFQWLIVAGEEPAGWISLKICPVERPHGKGSIGYAVAEAYRRRGIGRAGVAALLPIAFGRNGFNLERLEAVAAVDNVASRRVLEGNGFQFEGIQRGLLIIQGKRVDHAMYGLLRTDWEG